MKKIMFNDRYGLTKAVLEGRKTMTRRIIPQKLVDYCDNTMEILLKNGVYPSVAEVVDWYAVRSPYKIGEVISVAQCYADVHNAEHNYELQYALDNFILSHHKPKSKKLQDVSGWNNKMFVKAELMPHQIKIKNIKVEHLRYITNADILKEGIIRTNDGFTFVGNTRGEFLTDRCCFNAFIDRICGKGTWLANPLVWVYEFELIR